MLNFASLFSPIRTATTSSQPQLFSNPSTPLLSLLEDENFIAQFKSGSTQIRQYMTYQRMRELVDLITIVGDPSDSKRSYKFPLIAADLLSTDIPFVIEKLLPQEGVVVEQEKIVTTIEQEVEKELEEDEDDDLVLSSESDSQGEKTEDRESKSQDRTCGQDDEQFGQFVTAPVRQKRIVKVKEVVQSVTIIRKQHPALINNIIDYFSQEINYTLTSYCCKVLISLLNKHTVKFFSFLFQNEDRAVSILNHIESRSTVELLTRLFSIQIKECIDDRVALFKKITRFLGTPKDLDILNGVSATLCETFEKINIHLKTVNPCKDLQLYFRFIPEMLEESVCASVSCDEVLSGYAVPFINQLIISLTTEFDNCAIDISLIKFVDGAITKLKQALKEKKSRFGAVRVKMIEIFRNIIKRMKIQEHLSQQENDDFFSVLLAIVREYPLNNILHNEAFKIIEISLTLKNSPLLKRLIQKSKLIDWLCEQIRQESKDRANHQFKFGKGYSIHLLNLCKRLIQESDSNSPIKKAEYQAHLIEVSDYVQRVTLLSQRNLAGFTINRNQKTHIMTSQEEILKHHSAFLANSPPSVFNYDPREDFFNPIVLQQLQMQILGMQFQNKDQTRSQEIIEEEKHKAELIEANQQHKSAFWKMHLDYDVEVLMEEVRF